MTTPAIRACVECGSEFTVRWPNSTPRRFCSRSCGATHSHRVRRETPADYIRARVNVDREGHWIWMRYINADGYGVSNLPRTPSHSQWAHRVSYETFIGPIPDGLQIDHLCRVRACVNPEHLEPVTLRVNLLRGVGPSAMNAAKTHCIRGHAFDEENTSRRGGWRRCRTCQMSQQRDRRARQRVAS